MFEHVEVVAIQGGNHKAQSSLNFKESAEAKKKAFVPTRQVDWRIVGRRGTPRHNTTKKGAHYSFTVKHEPAAVVRVFTTSITWQMLDFDEVAATSDKVSSVETRVQTTCTNIVARIKAKNSQSGIVGCVIELVKRVVGLSNPGGHWSVTARIQDTS